MHARAAVSPLSGKPMREWLQVPCDWRRPEAKTQEGYALWWSDEDRYGQLLPRPSVEEIPSFYAGCSYYTHGDAFNEAPKRVIETNTFLACPLKSGPS